MTVTLGKKGRAALAATMGTLLWAAASGDTAPARATPVPVSAADLRVWWGRDAKDPDWVHGQVLISSPARDVWSRIEKVDSWPSIFSDIKRMRVLERDPPHWRIRVETESFDCGARDYHILFQEERTAEIRMEAPGFESRAYLSARDDPSGGALVSYRLFLMPTGFTGWFVSKKELRRRQEDMVVRYLADVRRLFGAEARLP